MNDVTRERAPERSTPEPSAGKPLVKTVTVHTELALTFELFTDRMSEWWPLSTHSVGLSHAASVTLERGAGGRIVETVDDGRLEVWGTVTDWEPPFHVAFTWHPGQDPAQDPAQATRVTVRFSEVVGGTEVELTHDGWAARADGSAARDSYDSGWDLVLGRLTDLARSATR